MYPLETRELAVEAVAAGFSLTEAAELAGCSRTAVVNWAKAAGVAPPPRKKAVHLPFDRKMELGARLEAGERAADLAAEFGIHAEGYKMNVTDEAEVQAAVDATIADFGRVDVLVNTAGILRFAAMEDLPLSDWEQVLNVNLTGYFITSQRFGREMIKAGQGRLVHISTVASHSPETFSGVYSSTKAGVNMMSKMLAAEWGPYGVRSNCVEPCFVKTPMSASFYADPEVEKSRSRLIATRRIGEVSDIANAVMFLASKRSDFTTGDAIKVDGGFSNMMGDLTAKPGGRRAYADNYLKNKGVELWSDESGVAKPTDQ